MTLYIHVGSHKTGTTAIQKCAAANRSVLRSQGLWYPSNQEIGRPEYHGHHHFAHAVAGHADSRFSLDDVQTFCRLLREGHIKNEMTLLSAEPFFRHFYGDSKDVWARRRTYLNRLRDLINIDDVVIVIVLRRQDSFARSLYQEKVKARGYKRTFKTLIKKEAWNFDYYTHVSLLSEIFSRVTVLIYEDLIADDLINGFFKGIGFAGASIASDRVLNKSLPLELTEYKRLLNGTPGISKDELGIVAKKITGLANRGGLDWPQDADWLSSPDMRAFVKGFGKDNERLRQQFLPDRPGPLFPAMTAGAERAAYMGLSVERFAEITMRLFRLGV
ncbi:MAG: hypothetical protein GY807_01630, partial [Gammaproteobacteria bacterium]|nr:hypothetical protein [Gammaproteobacteria bacterium]